MDKPLAKLPTPVYTQKLSVEPSKVKLKTGKKNRIFR